MGNLFENFRTLNRGLAKSLFYDINKEDANSIVNAIRAFASEMYNQKLNGSLLTVRESFPESAMKYNRKK